MGSPSPTWPATCTSPSRPSATSSTARSPPRGRRLRDALDDYFDVPRGTTLSIAEGEIDHYPADHLHELCLLAGDVAGEAVERLTEFLRAIT